jgi:DNA-binding NarL/FixJ family response regulator
LVADDPLVRAGLAALLSNQPGFMVVGQATTGTDVLADRKLYEPDVVVWDMGWEPFPDEADQDIPRSMLDQVAELREANLPLVALLPDSGHAAAAWNAGIRSLLLRDASLERLAAALRASALGLVTLEPDLATALLPVAGSHYQTLIEALTPRELEVLQLLAEGLANKAIAHRLDISEHTVKFHVNAIMSKLNAQSRTEAVVRATRLGLILL